VRWLILALSAVCLSTGAVLSVSLFVVSERSGAESAAEAQYRDENYSYVEPPQNATPAPSEVESPETAYSRWLLQESNAAKAKNSEAGGSGPVSEGSVPGASAPAEELSIMEPPAPYSQVVDNASTGWFLARGWEQRAGSEAQYYGKDYSYVEPSEVGAPALFRTLIPATDYYTVYARWPNLKGNNAATLFGVSTATGIEWIKVDQRRDGGMWVKLGAYKMEAGNRYAVQVSGYKAKGRVVADAVMVVRGTQTAPPETDTGVVGEASGARGQDVVQLARNHIGTPYIHSPPGSCEAYRSEDCSCLTSLVYGEWLNLIDHPVEQWKYGREVARSDLRPGDLVFFKEAGSSNPITHVGIYSGRGNIIHASSYWGRVVERPMMYVSGYYGAKRLVWN
jgi:cell wall-associated NlpC family hydrolase